MLQIFQLIIYGLVPFGSFPKSASRISFYIESYIVNILWFANSYSSVFTFQSFII